MVPIFILVVLSFPFTGPAPGTVYWKGNVSLAPVLTRPALFAHTEVTKPLLTTWETLTWPSALSSTSLGIREAFSSPPLTSNEQPLHTSFTHADFIEFPWAGVTSCLKSFFLPS